jgi:hypothetical protein
MSRPSKAEARRLELLEGATASLTAAAKAARILDLRLSQLRELAPGLGWLFVLARRELERATGHLDAAHEAVKQVLAADQERRSR